jgi:hypothetical protein
MAVIQLKNGQKTEKSNKQQATKNVEHLVHASNSYDSSN